MCNLIWLVFVVLLAACAGQGQTLPTLTTAALAIVTNTPVAATTTLAATSAPTKIAPTLAPTSGPTSSPTPTPTTISTALPNPSAQNVSTRASIGAVSGPVCNSVANAPAFAPGALGSATNPIVIAFVRYSDAQRTAEAGAQLAECLKQINGLTYDVLVGATERETVEALASGAAQVAFLNELSILYGQQEYGFETGLVILRTEQKILAPHSHREFFANKTAGIQTLADVKGKTFCFGEPNHVGNTVMPQIVLAGNGINLETEIKGLNVDGFADTIAMAVYRGECDAGSGYPNILTFPDGPVKTYPDLADKVETFYVTDRIPNDGVQYARDFDATMQEATSAALLTMAADNPGKHPPLVTLYKIEGFVRAGNEFYDEFRASVQRAGVDLAEVVR